MRGGSRGELAPLDSGVTRLSGAIRANKKPGERPPPTPRSPDYHAGHPLNTKRGRGAFSGDTAAGRGSPDTTNPTCTLDGSCAVCSLTELGLGGGAC